MRFTKKILYKSIGFILVIGASIIIPRFIVDFSENTKKFSGFYEITDNGGDISEIEINNQFHIGNIDVQQSIKNLSNLIEVEWDILYKSISYNPDSLLVVSYERNQSKIKIYLYSTIDKSVLSEIIMNSNLTIFLNPNYNLYGFRSYGENCDIKFRTDSLNFSIFEIETISGEIDVQINKSTIYSDFNITTISGDIFLKLDHIFYLQDFLTQTESGNQFFDFWDLKFLPNANLFAFSSSGIINVYWANHFIKHYEIDVSLVSQNKVYIKFWSPIEIMRYDVFLYSSPGGNTRFTTELDHFEEVSENHYHSINLNDPDLDLLNIRAVTGDDEAYVRIVDCFKWKRDCNWYTDVPPYEFSTLANYSIPKNEHNVSTIEFYSFGYIYLNTTKHLNITYELLPVSSENIIYLNWNLTYLKAMGYGQGSIDVIVSNKTEGDSLKMYVELQYELDLILPTFVGEDFTVFTHPNYTFYNFTI
jgi:hypothetical protein